MDSSEIFKNRAQAGRLLADRLVDLKAGWRGESTWVVALPRGGVPVGAEICRRLTVPLTVIGIRKIGAPGTPEFGIGAIAEEGFFWIEPERVIEYGITSRQLKELLAEKRREVDEAVTRYRKGKPLPDFTNSTILLVDDGLATGVTSIVAAQYLRSKGAKRVILAIPVCSRSGEAAFHRQFDEVICLRMPERFSSVGVWYEDFEQVTSKDVIELLDQAKCESEGMEVEIPVGSLRLAGILTVPREARGIVIFVHGSGSSRKSRRNRAVANRLVSERWATLLFDLLEASESSDPAKIFDITLLGDRLEGAIRWARSRSDIKGLPITLYGASTGVAAALRCAARHPSMITSVISRGGRSDLVIEDLPRVCAPVLLIVGGRDPSVLALNLHSMTFLKSCELRVIPAASHLFEEPGAMEEVIEYTLKWLNRTQDSRSQKHAA